MGLLLLPADIEDRIAAWTLLPAENGEQTQVLRYANGEKYDPHWVRAIVWYRRSNIGWCDSCLCFALSRFGLNVLVYLGREWGAAERAWGPGHGCPGRRGWGWLAPRQRGELFDVIVCASVADTAAPSKGWVLYDHDNLEVGCKAFQGMHDHL